ncbi:hypothetical protein SAMN05892883_3261 [Jatrophihabitans sp. GAS493]|uniref:DUF3093 domain-containing protein n=1 Tax=Jatrophihabitans sp. GAS493 TaxID=1907575 RepID=UPI000BC0E789|nr:DUF3093 domain-containing protein [Jatrophihabitans sp. GAS493]SOD74085.1 hypothetical protein SAMN05892883_3261 [Jatrophihabitans sp. GAS493]
MDESERNTAEQAAERAAIERDAVAHAINYRERLRTPWWWYLVGLAAASVLAAEFHISGLRLTDWIPFGVLLPLSAFIVWSFGRSDLRIADGELTVRGAHLPLRYVGAVVELDSTTLRRVVGREGDPQAFVSIRPFVGPGVQVLIEDPDDPTPYWILSTRHPHEVATLLRSVASQR